MLKWNELWSDLRRRGVDPAVVRARSFHDWVRRNDPVYAAVRRPGRAEAWAGGVGLLLIGIVVLALILFDWNMVRGPIGRWASAAYDRDIALQGDLDVHLFSWTPSAVVRGLKIGGPEWARDRDTADVDEIRASVRLRKLFAGQIEMPLLSFTRPRLVLITDKDGRNSWDLNPEKPDTGEGMKLPVIQQLAVTDAFLVFAMGLIVLQRVEMYIRARRVLAGGTDSHVEVAA